MSGTVDDLGPRDGPRQARAVPYLVLGLECDRPLAGSARFSLEAVDLVTLGRGPARSATRREERGVVVLDVRVPAAALSMAHARFVRSGNEWVLEDAGSTNGTFVNGARVERSVVREGDVVTAGRALFLLTGSRMTPVDARMDVDAADAPDTPGHRTLDPELAVHLEALARLARSDLSILVRGETGTGKELLARAVHERSGRAGAFIAVNCGAIPAGLVESTLFGHVRGAFSGALRDEPGLFRAAQGGTLFLDEVGDLPAAPQAALLRVLQEREVLPVGATRAVGVDLGIVAATHQPLEDLVSRGAFRQDLLARLAGFVIELPPLRDRTPDLGLIVAQVLRKTAGDRAEAVRFAPAAAEALFRYRWPLNVRELEQSLARALALAGDAPIDRSHLPASVTAPVEEAPPTPTEARLSERDQQLRLELLSQLSRHRGNLADVARAMGKARMQVHRWCKRFGIDPNTYRT